MNLTPLGGLFRHSLLKCLVARHLRAFSVPPSLCLAQNVASSVRLSSSSSAQPPTSDSTGGTPADLRERARQRIAEFEAKQSITPNSPIGILDRSPAGDLNAEPITSAAAAPDSPQAEGPNVFAPFPKNTNPVTGEILGPTGPEPTRYGDWERKGRCSDF